MVSYLIKCIICSGILLAVYHLFLEREKMLRFNRFYLLGAMVFSLIAPLTSIEMPSQIVQKVVLDKPVSAPISDFATSNLSQTASSEDRTALPAYLPWLFYGLIAAALVLRIGIQMLMIIRSKSGRRIVPFETAKLVLMPDNIPTYTFFNFIFISEKAFDNRAIPEEILTHEHAHAKQMHSLDVLFAEILFALCWFNPLLLLYCRAIRLNHEYLADESVLTDSTDVKQYQLLLLDTLLAHRSTTLASSFNYPFTKKRLAMMTTNINLRMQFAKKVFIALLLPLLALALAEKTYSQQHASKKASASDRKIETTHQVVSEAEMQDFFATIEKNTRVVKTRKGLTNFHIEVSPPEENRLYAVYERMSDEQKAQIKAKEISVFRMDIPVKKNPTPEMFENWKRTDVFGVWLNNKHVPNSELNKYKYSDIAEYDLSKLYGAALKGRSYKYQLDILTNDYFDKTYDARVNNRVIITRVSWLPRKEAPGKGK